MANPTTKARNKERQFDITELFFSTTDLKGIVRYGNDVFARVADYNLNELIDKPHNIIRHPDMPRAVFQLLWDYLQANKPIVAYVKNLAKDGCYYWVLAIAMPCEGGYLSIRLKPSTPLFKAAQDIYAQVHSLESKIESNDEPGAQKRAIEAGVAKITELLNASGFESYDKFMWAAFVAELTNRQSILRSNNSHAEKNTPLITDQTSDDARTIQLKTIVQTCNKLDKQLDALFANIGNFESLNNQLITKSSFILRLAESIRRFSINAVVEACRLEDTGAALTVVAEAMGRSSNQSSTAVKQLTDSISKLSSFLAEMVFNLVIPKLQIEMINTFAKELLESKAHASEASADGSEEHLIMEHIDILIRTFTERTEIALPLLTTLQKDLSAVNVQIEDLQKFVKALRFIQFSGTVEAARTNDADSFALIFDEALKQIEEAHNELAEFGEAVWANLSQTKTFEKANWAVKDNMQSLLSCL